MENPGSCLPAAPSSMGRDWMACPTVLPSLTQHSWYLPSEKEISQCLGKPHSNHLQAPSVVQVSPLVTQLPHPRVFLACLGKTFLVFPHIRISPVASCNQRGWGFFSFSFFLPEHFVGKHLLRCWMGATKRKAKQVVKNWRCFSFWFFSVLATISEMPHQSHPL